MQRPCDIPHWSVDVCFEAPVLDLTGKTPKIKHPHRVSQGKSQFRSENCHLDHKALLKVFKKLSTHWRSKYSHVAQA